MTDAAQLRRAARAAYKGGEFEAAVRAYERLFADGSGGDPALEAQDRSDHGSALIRCGRAPDAVVAFQRATELAPGEARFRIKLAQTLSRLDRHEEAVEQYRRVVELQPEDADAHAALGTELRWTGRTADARAELERALALDPDHVDARLTLMALSRPTEFTGVVPEAAQLDAEPARRFDSAPTRGASQPRAPVWLLLLQGVALVTAGVWVRSLFP